MTSQKSGFSIVIFERKQARSEKLADYLAIYLQNFAPVHRTKTNELIDFLENPDEGRTIVYFGLAFRGKPCGFATLMIYKDSNLGVVDHIAIAPTTRGYGAFFSFADMIADYLEGKRIALNYLFAEITLEDQPISTGINPITLVRLMRFIGFRVVNLRYYAPDPMIVTNKEACRAALMVISSPEKNLISSHELIALLKVIFFQHYGLWYRRIMSVDHYHEYDLVIRETFSQMSLSAQSSKIIKINGMKNLNLPYVVEPKRLVTAGLAGYIAIIAVPAFLTIALAIEQETKLTIVVAIATVGLFMLALIPRCRGILFRFFQLEQ